MKYFLLLTFSLLTILSKAQKSTTQYLGVIEANLDWIDNKEKLSYVVVPMFQYNGSTGWQIFNDCPSSLVANICYKGKVLKQLNAQLTDSAYQSQGCYYKFNQKLKPKINSNKEDYYGFTDIKIDWPLIITTSNYYKQKNSLNPHKTTNHELSLIKDFIFNTVAENDLGDITISKDSILGKVSEAYTINNITLLKTDVHFNMLVIKEKRHIDLFGDGYISSNEERALHHNQLTPNAWFIIKDNKVSYIDYDLALLDYGDYDNNNNNEYIFKMDKDNNDGYLLLYDNLSKTLLYDWNYR